MAHDRLIDFIICLVIFYMLVAVIILLAYNYIKLAIKSRKSKNDINKIILFNPETKEKKIIESLEDIKKDIGKKAYNELKQFISDESDLNKWINIIYKDYIII